MGVFRDTSVAVVASPQQLSCVQHTGVKDHQENGCVPSTVDRKSCMYIACRPQEWNATCRLYCEGWLVPLYDADRSLPGVLIDAQR